MAPAKYFRLIGLLGVITCLVLFIRTPSFPTPDKLLVFLTFGFMMFGRGKALLLRLGPFVGLLLVYESFRGLVPKLNHRVEYHWMIWADDHLFGGSLPTTTLQHWLWHGHIQWYDFIFYLVYMLHFVLPMSLALLIWKYRDQFYWQYIASLLSLSFAGFITFLLFPAAPPWLAMDKHVIISVTRISSQVWLALGIHDFPSLYNTLSPNPVAAVPSLHAAYATLFLIFVYKLFDKRWAALASLYPLLIYVGTVYQGEHYAIDEIIGAVYAVGTYFLINYLWRRYHIVARIQRRLRRPNSLPKTN